MSVKPLTPAEIVTARNAIVPDAAITEMNEYLTRMYNGNYATNIGFTEVRRMYIAAQEANAQEPTMAMVQSLPYLFRDFGWQVIYCSPNADEEFDPYFSFRVAK
jgi:hypothetical protein